MKGQLFAFDFSTTFIIFLVFIIAIASLLVYSDRQSAPEIDFELEFIFANLEHNLLSDGDPSNDFLAGYRIDPVKLDTFSSTPILDTYVVGNVGSAKGIGLRENKYDVCLYMTDNDNSRLPFGGQEAIGEVLSGSCHDVLIADQNPCEGYNAALALFRPVLYEVGNVDDNRIIQLNLVLCEI